MKKFLVSLLVLVLFSFVSATNAHADCTDSGKTYNTGDYRYVCGGDSSSCASNAGVGVPFQCNSDGTWTNTNPFGECTTVCPHTTPTPTPTSPPATPQPTSSRGPGLFSECLSFETTTYSIVGIVNNDPNNCPTSAKCYVTNRDLSTNQVINYTCYGTTSPLTPTPPLFPTCDPAAAADFPNATVAEQYLCPTVKTTCVVQDGTQWDCYSAPTPTFAPPGPPCDPQPDGGCKSINTGVGPIATDPFQFAKSVFGIFLSLSGGLALLLIMASGYRLMASQGNPEKIQEARENLTSAVIGLLIVILAMVILQVIGVDLLHIPGLGS